MYRVGSEIIVGSDKGNYYGVFKNLYTLKFYKRKLNDIYFVFDEYANQWTDYCVQMHDSYGQWMKAYKCLDDELAEVFILTHDLSEAKDIYWVGRQLGKTHLEIKPSTIITFNHNILINFLEKK